MDKRIKVLMVGPARCQQGGISAVVNDYFEEGIEDRCDITYLDCTCNGGKIAKLAQGLKSLAWEKRHAGEFDVVHVHMGGGNSFFREKQFAMLGVRMGIPTVLHVHDGLFRDTFENASEKQKESYRKVFSAVDRVVVLSKSWKQFFEKNVTRKDNIEVIPNGIRVPGHVRLNKEHGTVLFLGHFDDNKNALLLIEAIAKARADIPDICCYFGADGELESGKALVSELGCEKECHLLGWVGVQEKQALLDKCSIYCLPSRNEAFPVGLLEGMANGCCALVTPVGGMADIVEDKKTGLFVPVNDAEALAKSLVWLIRDEAARRAISEAGVAEIRERYDSAKILSRIVGMYKSLVC